MPQQVNDAGLHCRLRENRGDRFRKPFQPVDDGDHDVFDATVFQLVHDAQPELGALILLEPQAENFLGAVGAHAERGVHRLVADQPFIPDLNPQGIEEHQRIDCFQGAGLPGCDLLQNRVGDRADQIRRDIDPVEIAQMANDLARAHDAGVHRGDLVFEPREAVLVLGDQLRIKPGLAVTRNLQLDLAVSAMTVFLP